MTDSIKCPKCQTWNENRDYCSQCNHLLNFEIQRTKEAEAKRIAYENRPLDKVDLFFLKIKTSNKLSDKILYWLFQSAWYGVIALATGALLFAALGPG